MLFLALRLPLLAVQTHSWCCRFHDKGESGGGEDDKTLDIAEDTTWTLGTIIKNLSYFVSKCHSALI